eukprot:CAMPEP_0118906984 /NCGR_PEP_ID=MMETSP1166-20130328/10640_1 /TAXON_ID=1104430 /ORGANISM="Chrysoreinhardia sp, Strain CCMP3193" /LENGTH=199 /DNA_ID=CAMNT_0006846341 /DNA_START=89 /DNA_END=688 /DNA_ORIENTATION=+
MEGSGGAAGSPSSSMSSAQQVYLSVVGAPRAAAVSVAGYFCSTCEAMVSESRRDHETSLAHTFSLRLRGRQRRVAIPEDNVGSRLLERLGWRDDGECPGLGARGTGRIFPVQAAAKRTRTGLGALPDEPRKDQKKTKKNTTTTTPRGHDDEDDVAEANQLNLVDAARRDFRYDDDVLDDQPPPSVSQKARKSVTHKKGI